MTLAFQSPTGVVSKSLKGGSIAPHVDPNDVESYLELAEAGMLSAHPGCGAVQNNLALRHDTRTALSRKAE